ncbi:F0F1 ATP synthase subunit delta [Pelagibacterium sp. 26DY04]|uniref:F0F1 ATP synthase subunit delta n=1 Tax=Pelagibacterium sp. 26DY04 TaxID=2967130 RepID=UPI0028160CBE|nr:F0F1 ATP synthase subunit delta [Pelagibacterium sp. 26DY04]WMT86847.1 F0F1 ATP synthase subunit delta [Pelagibacterium sp. 26DY04]
MSAPRSVLSKIARPYASALFDLASEAGSVPAVEADLDAIADLIQSSDDFSRFLFSPTIATDAKSAALNSVIEKTGPVELVANTLKVVAQNGRLFALSEIIAEFKRLAAEARNEVSAEVTSAAPLSDQQQSELAAVLKDKIGKDVSLNTRVDESLIGGLVVKVGSQMIDTSLKTKLSAMKIAMKGVS